MIKEILKKSKETKEIIGHRLYEGDEDFWCGYVENFNDNIIQLRHFDQHGNDDEIIFEQIEYVESILPRRLWAHKGFTPSGKNYTYCFDHM